MVAEVRAIDLARQDVTVATSGDPEVLRYDRLVLTLGSELLRPAIPGLAANSFDDLHHLSRAHIGREARRQLKRIRDAALHR